MAWWWNSSNVFEKPFALLYFHVPKCGGASVLYWMLRHNQQFSLKLDYTQSKLFMQMHSDIFAGAKWSGPPPVPNWKHVNVAAEYHASTERLYHYMIPRLRKLRAKYRSVAGRMVTFITIVDPITVIKSFYQMWPPRHNGAIVSLKTWLGTPSASGIITRSLSNGATGCNINRAMGTLSTFDRIIFLRKNGNMSTFCTFLKWHTCPRFPYKHLNGPMSNVTRLEVRNTPRVLFEPAALCDRKMLAASKHFSQKFIFTSAGVKGR